MTKKPKAFTFFNVFGRNLAQIFIRKFIRNLIRKKKLSNKNIRIFIFYLFQRIILFDFYLDKKSRIR